MKGGGVIEPIVTTSTTTTTTTVTTSTTTTTTTSSLAGRVYINSTANIKYNSVYVNGSPVSFIDGSNMPQAYNAYGTFSTSQIGTFIVDVNASTARNIGTIFAPKSISIYNLAGTLLDCKNWTGVPGTATYSFLSIDTSGGIRIQGNDLATC